MQRYRIPKMCMQPIVENAVHHAAPSGGSIQITISVRVENDSLLLIEIRDDGAGVAPRMLDSLQSVLRGDSDTPIISSSSSGLGLDNVHKRLQAPLRHGLRPVDQQRSREYTCVTLRLPWENENLGGW